MTEKEAKSKWCPFARVAPQGNDGAANRWHAESPVVPWNDKDKDPHALCVASACMAWRIEVRAWWRNEHGGLEEGPKAVGFCGLAGAPQ